VKSGKPEIEAWLDGLEKLIPEDGRLTHEILETAGPLPVPTIENSSKMDAESTYLSARGAQIEAKTFAMGLAKNRSVFALNRAAMWRGSNEAMQKREWAQSDFWKNVQGWIEATY
jgi:hypothetical protein